LFGDTRGLLAEYGLDFTHRGGADADVVGAVDAVDIGPGIGGDKEIFAVLNVNKKEETRILKNRAKLCYIGFK